MCQKTRADLSLAGDNFTPIVFRLGLWKGDLNALPFTLSSFSFIQAPHRPRGYFFVGPAAMAMPQKCKKARRDFRALPSGRCASIRLSDDYAVTGASICGTVTAAISAGVGGVTTRPSGPTTKQTARICIRTRFMAETIPFSDKRNNGCVWWRILPPLQL